MPDFTDLQKAVSANANTAWPELARRWVEADLVAEGQTDTAHLAYPDLLNRWLTIQGYPSSLGTIADRWYAYHPESNINLLPLYTTAGGF
jgi:hypothetical protein